MQPHSELGSRLYLLLFLCIVLCSNYLGTILLWFRVGNRVVKGHLTHQ